MLVLTVFYLGFMHAYGRVVKTGVCLGGGLEGVFGHPGWVHMHGIITPEHAIYVIMRVQACSYQCAECVIWVYACVYHPWTCPI